MTWKRSIITLALAAAAFMAPAALLAEEVTEPAAVQAATTSAQQAAPAPVAAPAEAAPSSAPAARLDTGDNAWLLISSALVLLMLPGLALFYGGMVRSKNILSTMMHSFVAMGIVGVQWYVMGYSLVFGTDIGGFSGGVNKLLLYGVALGSLPGNISQYTFSPFQGVFAIITIPLISGALAERIKFSAYCVFALIWTTLVYDPIAHWVWGGGWIAKLSPAALDFAGGTVVHLASGVSALAALVFLGRRHGFPTERMAPHNLPFTLLGAGLLWFGWYGFNAGSALAANGTAALAFVNTTVAPAAAGLSWMIAEWIHSGRPSALGFASGVVAGLVGVTPAAGFVTPGWAVIIGLGAGVVCYGAILVKARLKYDDSLDAFGVHGVGGTFGALATGLVASVGAKGLIYGEPAQFMSNLIGIAAAGAYAFIVTLAIAFILDKTIGLRVEKEDEIMGLDQPQPPESAYT